MANKKISQLTAAGPLTGNEPLPIVQGGVTVKTSVGDIASFGSGSIFYPNVITYSGTTCAGVSMSPYDGGGPLFIAAKEINAPNLVSVGTSVVIQSDNGYLDSQLESISMPLLETIGLDVKVGSYNYYGFNAYDHNYLESIDLSSLKEIHNTEYAIYISSSGTSESMALLTTVNLNSLESIINSDGSFLISGCSSLSNLSFPSLTSFPNCQYFNVGANALNQTSVDSILNTLANVLNISNAYVSLSGGTNAAPSVTGQGYVDTLVDNGCTVYTN